MCLRSTSGFSNSVFPSDFSRRSREQFSQLRRLSDNDKKRRLGARKGHRHDTAASMSQQVLSGLQQPLLQAQPVRPPLLDFVHVKPFASRRGVRCVWCGNSSYVATRTRCIPRSRERSDRSCLPRSTSCLFSPLLTRRAARSGGDQATPIASVPGVSWRVERPPGLHRKAPEHGMVPF